jgi:dTDP-glucose 4,6-dehydratase
MNVLVTGGSGFIGSNLIKYLGKNHPGWSFVNFSRGNNSRFNEPLTQNYKFIKGDLMNKQLLQIALQDVDYVYHLAAESHVREAENSPLQTIESNVLGTQSLLDAIKKANIKKMVYLSSSEVYGFDMAESLDGFNELYPFNPAGLYAATKAASELLILAHHNAFGTPAVIARSCNVFGPCQYPNKIVSKLTTNLIEDRNIILYGKGDDYRTYIYINDLCETLELLALKGNTKETYNIATRDVISNLDLAKILLRKLEKDESFIEFKPNTISSGKKFTLTSKKIQSLGWIQKTDLHEGLDKTIQWYKDNQDWWKQKLKSPA